MRLFLGILVISLCIFTVPAAAQLLPAECNNINGFCCGEIADGYLYVSGYGALYCYDLSNPHAPQFVAISEPYSRTGNIHEYDGMALGNGHAFVGLYGAGGFSAIDLSDRTQMEVDGA